MDQEIPKVQSSKSWPTKAKKLLYDLELAAAAVKHTWHAGNPGPLSKPEVGWPMLVGQTK